MRLVLKLLYSVLLLFFSLVTDAQLASINADIENVKSLTTEAQVLITSESNLLSDVMQITEWEDYRAIVDIPDDNALWVKFRVDNGSSGNRQLTLIAGNTFIDQAEAYILDEQGRIVQSSRINDEANDTGQLIRSGFEMAFISQAQSSFTIYLIIRDDGISLLPLELWQSDAHKEQRVKRLVLIGALCGGLSLLSIHFLLSYILKSLPARFWFCIFSIAAMTTMLSAEGILPMLFNLPSYAAELTAVSLLVTLFSALKITRVIFVPVANVWWWILYLSLLIPVVNIFWLNDFYQIMVLLALAGIFIVNKLVATVVYWKTVDLRSAALYFCGWAALTLVAVFEFTSFVYTQEHLFFSTPQPFIVSSIGVMLVGVAIISREQSLITQRNQGQTDQLEQIRQYKELFDNSFEGLFVATSHGEIVTVNPAFCALFGYDKDHDCVKNKIRFSDFFANERDVELMLGELNIQQLVLGKEVRAIRADGSEFWLSITSQLKKANDESLQYGSLFDITERRIHHINLQYLNTHDQLTGLFNRRYFLELLNHKIADNDAVQRFGILVVDVDQFNSINKSCGHNAGDIFIKEIALELYDVISDKYPLARLNADQFGVIVDVENTESLVALANAIVDKIEKYEFKWDKRSFYQTVCVGVAVYDDLSPTSDELMSFADTACQLAKADKESCVHVFSREIGISDTYEQELFWANEVDSALRNNRFEILFQHYRPLNASMDEDYIELFVRLRTKDDEVVSPEFFLSNAEKNYVSHKIDRWVIETCFKWLKDNPQKLTKLGRININLSSCAIVDDDFRFFLFNAFKKFDIPFNKICFEIMETTAIIKMRESQEFIHEFQKYGCLFAIDDFGCGFSSYTYLKSLPVDFLKIDGNFIREILQDRIDMAMVNSICDVAKSMNIQTIAESVESQEILVQVGKLGIDYVQGFFIARPEPLQNFSHFNKQPL
ncbi:MAG: EAL domain-containing protein [Pseudomonadota bacterium]